MTILVAKIANSILRKPLIHAIHYTLLICLSFYAAGQSASGLRVSGDEQNILMLDTGRVWEVDELSVKKKIQSHIDTARKGGYLLANLDSLYHHEGYWYARVFVGRRHDRLQVMMPALSVLDDLGIKSKKLNGRYSPAQLPSLYTRVLHRLEDDGYPFARVQLDSVAVEGSKLTGTLQVTPGRKITFDSLEITPSEVVKDRFLSRYLHILYGEAFSQKKVDDIPVRLKALPYLSLQQKPTLYFALQKAQVKLSVTPRRVNVFDGILGVVPAGDGRKTDVNGELKLQLHNLLKSGKRLDFHWQKITVNTQQLNAYYQHPYIFGSPFYFSLTFNQLKENTSFSNTKIAAGLEYELSAVSRLGFVYHYKNGNQLNETAVAAGDFVLHSYGLNFTTDQLDDPLWPHRGWKLAVDGAAGNKKTIAGGGNVTGENSAQYESTMTVLGYAPVGKQTVLAGEIGGGVLYNDVLFANDLYRIGGMQTLRGFNENFFFASRFARASVEWQVYLEKRSYVYLFYDQAVLYQDVFEGRKQDYPSGVGIGMKIAADNGSFNLIYGMGRNASQGLSFARSKIHFGYTARF